MCVIGIYENNKPKLKDLVSMEDMNSDGAGIAWRENGKVRYEKGIDSKKMWKIIKEIDLPFIVHFRIKSSGSICDELTHPFEVDNNTPDLLHNSCDKVLFHNGTYTSWKDDMLKTCLSTGIKLPNGHLSDSKALAWLCSVYGDNYLKVIITQSRFTIFTPTEILKYGDWKEVSGGLCSNDNHVDDDKEPDVIQQWQNKKQYNKTGSEWYDNAWRTQKEIKEIEDLKALEAMNNHESETQITIYSKDVTKHVRKDGYLNVWSKKGVLLWIENVKGLIIKDYRAKNNMLTNNLKKIDESEEEINKQIDELNIFDMTDEEQKRLYEKTCLDLIKVDSKVKILQRNLTEYEDNKDGLREDKRKAKIKSTKNRISKGMEKQIFYTTILDDIMQNQDQINHSDEIDDIINDFPDQLVQHDSYGMF